MLIHENELLDLFYSCESWSLLNNRNSSVDVDELIEKLKEREKK